MATATRYDEHTATVLKGRVHAETALEGIEVAKRAVRSIPMVYPKGATKDGSLERAVAALATAEGILDGVLAQATIECREIGL